MLEGLKATDWIAIYAALVSTWVFGWQVRQARPRIIVSAMGGLVNDDYGAYISIRNNSVHAIKIESCSLLYQSRKQPLWSWLKVVWQFKRVPRFHGWNIRFLPDSLKLELPARLAPYDSLNIFIPESALLDLFGGGSERRLIFKIQDAMWKDYYTNEFSFGFPDFDVLEEGGGENSKT